MFIGIANDDGDGIGERWLIDIRIWVGRQGVGIIILVFSLCFLISSVPLLFRRLEHDIFCLFLCFFFVLFVPVPFTGS